MKIHIRYFASVREHLGAGEALVWPDDAAQDQGGPPRTVGELREWLIARSPRHAQALDHAKALRMALDQTMCKPDQPLSDGAEVAFFPPVTGG